VACFSPMGIVSAPKSGAWKREEAFHRIPFPWRSMAFGRPNIEGGHLERDEMLVVQTVSHCFNECESVTVDVFLSSGAIRLNCTQRVVQEFFVNKRSASHWFAGYFRVRRWTAAPGRVLAARYYIHS
jgi:hypothetical protein